MVVGILSDTHLTGVEARFIDLLAGPLGPAQVLIHAGDHASSEVVDHLEYADARPYHGVAGNMDPPQLLARLGTKKILTLDGLSVGLIHGHGPGAGIEYRLGYEFPSQPDLIIFGHSHRPLAKRIGGTLYLNPGSPTSPRGGPPTVMLLTIEKGATQVEILEV